MTERSTIHEAVGGAMDALHGVKRIGFAFGSAFGLGRLRKRPPPGTAPGIDHFEMPSRPGTDIRITVFDYGADHIDERTIDDLDELLESERPPDASVRWINVDGLDPFVVDKIRTKYGIHTLAAEDVIHVPQRPRVEAYENHLYVIARMVGITPDAMMSEQVSLFLFEDTLITFQEVPGDAFEQIRKRLRTKGTRLRERDTSFLLYALLDAIVDHCFPLVERYTEALDALEEDVMSGSSPDVVQQILGTKRDLTALRRILWSTRELLDALQRNERVSDSTATYLRDVYTHAVQLVDIVESQRETAAGLVDLHMSIASNKMNEVMKMLTIIATIFIPITFIAGVYGMNFEHLPELKWRYAYGLFWITCGTITGALLLVFRRRGWI